MVNKTMDEKQGRRRRRQQEEAVEEPAELLDDEALDDDEADEADDDVNQRGITPKKGRATPGRRKKADKEEEGNAVQRSIGGLQGYLIDTRDELRKVVWPTRAEVWRLLRIVAVTITIAALVLGGFSLLFTEVVRIGLATPEFLLGLLAVIVVVAGAYLFLSNRRSGRRF
jgi:preprotein translocase SecE subunit